jgi:hypothetical protein
MSRAYEVDVSVLLLTATLAIGISCAVTAIVVLAEEDDEDDEDECGEMSMETPEVSAAEKESLYCILTGERMTDPVCTCDGHSYERSAILQWFKSNQTSPRTNQ